VIIWSIVGVVFIQALGFLITLVAAVGDARLDRTSMHQRLSEDAHT
jgi:hypothetical protein